jgi:hypothetical protein
MQRRSGKRWFICLPESDKLRLEVPLVISRKTNLTRKWRQERALHDRIGLICVHKRPWHFFWPNVQKKIIKIVGSLTIWFLARVAFIKQLIWLYIFVFFMQFGTWNVCQTYKKLSKIIEHMQKTITYIFTLFWHFWVEILTLFHVRTDLIHFTTSNQKTFFINPTPVTH